jgi:quinol monooxygenase YgiN
MLGRSQREISFWLGAPLHSPRALCAWRGRPLYPQSGHSRRTSPCLLCAGSGHPSFIAFRLKSDEALERGEAKTPMITFTRRNLLSVAAGAAAAVTVPFDHPVRAAQDASTTYIVGYIEVAPSSARIAAVSVLRALRDASRKEAGNSGFEVLQRIGRSQQFAILEVWSDAKVQASHAAAAGTARLHDKLKPYLAAPIDGRLHTGFAVGQSKGSGAGSVYVLTHVDLIGAKKDEGLAAIKQLSIDSAQDAGLLRYDVLQQSSRPNHLTLVEVWRGMADLEKHEVAPHTRKFSEVLLPMSGSLYDQRLYQTIN